MSRAKVVFFFLIFSMNLLLVSLIFAITSFISISFTPALILMVSSFLLTFLGILLPVPLPSQWVIVNLYLPRRHSAKPRLVWPQVSMYPSVLWVVSQCAWNHVCTLEEWSLCFPALWSSCTESLLAFQSKCSGVSSVQGQTLRLWWRATLCACVPV